MRKKHLARLSDDEQAELAAVVQKLNGTSQKARRAPTLLKADAAGPSGTR